MASSWQLRELSSCKEPVHVTFDCTSVTLKARQGGYGVERKASSVCKPRVLPMVHPVVHDARAERPVVCATRHVYTAVDVVYNVRHVEQLSETCDDEAKRRMTRHSVDRDTPRIQEMKVLYGLWGTVSNPYTATTVHFSAKL